MSSQKYPAEIIEAMAKVLHDQYCGCGDALADDSQDQRAAVAALDALGLFVMEQWSNTDLDWMPVPGYQNEFGVGGPPRGFKANRRRFDLHAKTSWVGVD